MEEQESRGRYEAVTVRIARAISGSVGVRGVAADGSSPGQAERVVQPLRGNHVRRASTKGGQSKDAENVPARDHPVPEDGLARTSAA